jgi:hypothetical protein
MNEFIARRSLEEDALLEYVEKAKVLDGLYHRTGELEETIEAMDKDIDEVDETGLDEIVEAMCKARNTLNFERLELEIQIHKLEIWLAEFERARLLTR